MLYNKWGVPKQLYKIVLHLRKKTFTPPHGIDSPNRHVLGAEYWHAYPIRNYSYEYNSWGFRGEDYEQYCGKEVNLCLGDSNTVNIGGPVEHSWVYQLSKYYDIPTLNFGVDGLSFTDVDSLIEKQKSNFKVKKIFVLYNLFDRDQQIQSGILPAYNNLEIENKIKAFKQFCFRNDVVWQFDPPWSFRPEELQCLYEYFPKAHNYLKSAVIDYRKIDYQSAVASSRLRDEYEKLAGTSWISYPEFLQKLIINPNGIFELFSNTNDQRLIREFIRDWVSRLLYTNRDGYHQSEYINKLLADYFYQSALENY